DPFGVYFILTSADVRQTMGDSEFCIQYCGYHSDTFRFNQDIKYAVVGDPNRCGGSCSFSSSAHGNVTADSMTVVMSHELGEALTDPRPGDTWVDSSGNEMGDKCAGIVGDLQFPTGVFSVQALWLNSGAGSCAFGFSPPPPPPPHRRRPLRPPPPPPPPPGGCGVASPDGSLIIIPDC